MMQSFAALIISGMLLPGSLHFFVPEQVDSTFPVEIASAYQRPAPPTRVATDSLGLRTTAVSILATDNASGYGLYSKDPARSSSIASITKLMTALVWLDSNPDWDAVVTIQESDIRAGGLIQLNIGEEVTQRDLFYLALVGSANEAAVALARSVDAENFPSLMNKKAHELGMSRTFFQEPTGLDGRNVSTALDLALLAEEAFSREEIQDATERVNYTFSPIGRAPRTTYTTNQLLTSFLNRDGYQIIGGKTGFLNEAGYCLLVRAQREDGTAVNLVLLGADTQLDRWQEAKGIIDWVFENYVWQTQE